MTPRSSRVYDTAHADAPFAPTLRALGFAFVAGARSVDLWALEMPTGSVDACIAATLSRKPRLPRRWRRPLIRLGNRWRRSALESGRCWPRCPTA
jgi:hypothetical protein